MFLVVAGVYLGIGILAAAVVVALFPPRPGYSPPLHVWCLAVAALACFWPALVLIGLSHLIGWLFERQAMKSRPKHAVRAPRFRYRVVPDDARLH